MSLARQLGQVLAYVLIAIVCDVVQAANVVVGMNIVNPMRASVADQNEVLRELKAANVRVIRLGLTPDDKGMDFARRVTEQGIKIQLILSPQYLTNAPSRAYDPKQFPQMWGGHPLSSADPLLSKAYYQSLLQRLEAQNIVLAGMELGNEINWAAFNPEFLLPGEGKILSLGDLEHDPEGKQIAKGYLQYLKVLAALKEARDHSRLNRSTPIILAGLVSAADGENLYNNKREDMVSLAATIDFLRAHGLDSLVDAYGIHTYPSSENPADAAAYAKAAAKRAARFISVDLAPCRAAGITGGKPCWITEWGFPNKDLSCPSIDAARSRLVKEMYVNFGKAAAQGRLIGLTYFAWNSDPWAKQPDPLSVYRCGALTQSGREAMKPIIIGGR